MGRPLEIERSQGPMMPIPSLLNVCSTRTEQEASSTTMCCNRPPKDLATCRPTIHPSPHFISNRAGRFRASRDSLRHRGACRRCALHRRHEPQLRGVDVRPRKDAGQLRRRRAPARRLPPHDVLPSPWCRHWPHFVHLAKSGVGRDGWCATCPVQQRFQDCQPKNDVYSGGEKYDN